MLYDRKALIVGIDYYQAARQLKGCVSDAHAVKAALNKNADGTINFHQPKLMTGTGAASPVNTAELRTAIRENLTGKPNIAFFYFAGHGYVDDAGGYLMCSDSTSGSGGIPLSEVVTLANKSEAANTIIVLDSCHSGAAGAKALDSSVSEVTEGLTILTAATADQYSKESNSSGLFTNLFVDALNGSASNLLGDVTPASVYAHIDQSLGPHSQRPVFKTNVTSFVSLRKVIPPVKLENLQRIDKLFPRPGYDFSLDPTFEPERGTPVPVGVPEPDPVHTEIFDILQEYNRIGLVVPVGARHMYHAAMESKACQLTALGEHYRELAAKGLI